MKKLALIVLCFITTISFGQHPSMTISHSGLAPSNVLTVYEGDLIDFIHGGGGPHPMMEGWESGETSSPIDFESQTVTSGDPLVTFSIDTPGTYYFHCGTNPGNENNWGKIIVLEAGTTDIPTNQVVEYTVYPNPANETLTIDGFTGTGEIFNLIGEKVMDINSSTININVLPVGLYVIKIGDYRTTFVKN